MVRTQCFHFWALGSIPGLRMAKKKKKNWESDTFSNDIPMRMLDITQNSV